MPTKKKVRSLQAFLLVAALVTGLVAVAIADDRAPLQRPDEVTVTATPASGSPCGLQVVIDGGEPFVEYVYVRRAPQEFTDHQYFLEVRGVSGWEPVYRDRRLVLSQFIVDGQEVIFHPTTNAPIYPDQEWSVDGNTYRWSHHATETNVHEVTSYERSPVPLDLGDGWTLDRQRTVSADPHHARLLIDGEASATRTWRFGRNGHDRTITWLEAGDAYEVQLRVGDPLTQVVPDEWSTYASGIVTCDDGPDREVVAGAWEVTSFDCVRGQYSETRTVTTIEHRWDAGSGAWVPRELSHDETRTRTATAEEMAAEGCQAPADVTSTTPWTRAAEPECGDRVVEQTRTITSTPFVWDEQGGRWLHDASMATDEVERREVDLSLSQRRAACGEQPAATWSYGEWVEDEITCGATEVARTRTATLTPYVFDDEAAAWVEDPDNATSRQERDTRELSDTESQAACPPRPEPTVVQTDWEGAWTCGDTEVTETRTVITTPHVWSTVLGRYIEDTRNASEVEQTRSRALTDDDLADCASRPEPTVDEGEWVDAAWACGATETVQTRTVTTTPFVWDELGETWVEDATNAAEEEQSRTRHLTDDESRSPCPPQPDDVIEFGAWEDHDWACEDSTTLRSRDVIRTPHQWDAGSGTWVLDPAASVVDVEVASRDLSDSESREPCASTGGTGDDAPPADGTEGGAEDGTGGDPESDGEPEGEDAPGAADEDAPGAGSDGAATEDAPGSEADDAPGDDEDEVLAGSRDDVAAVSDGTDAEGGDTVADEVAGEGVGVSDPDDPAVGVLDAAAEGVDGRSAALPRTGASVLALLVAGLLALSAGVSALARSRRRSGNA